MTLSERMIEFHAPYEDRILREKKICACGRRASVKFKDEYICDLCLNPEMEQLHAVDFVRIESPLADADIWSDVIEDKKEMYEATARAYRKHKIDKIALQIYKQHNPMAKRTRMKDAQH